jgi:hypothetical protein
MDFLIEEFFLGENCSGRPPLHGRKFSDTPVTEGKLPALQALWMFCWIVQDCFLGSGTFLCPIGRKKTLIRGRG